MHFVMRGAIMRQHHQRVFVLVSAQPLHMRRERLPLRLVVVEHSDLAADKLRNPDHGIVGLRASAADVPKCFERSRENLCPDANRELWRYVRFSKDYRTATCNTRTSSC